MQRLYCKLTMDFFAFVREKLREDVPMYLRNILKYSGYDNRHSMANISEKEINQIELFAKTQLKEILSKRTNVNYEEFYHLCNENIEDFIILPGHKKLLLAISEMCAEENNKLRLKETFFNEDYNPKRRKTLNTAGSWDDFFGITSETVNEEKSGDAINIQEESKWVYDVCYQWIKKFSDLLNESEQNKVIETLHRLEIKISPSSDEDTVYFGYIKCSICQIEIKTRKRVRKEGQSTWLISNFYKHYRTHFSQKPVSAEKKMDTYHDEENDSIVFEQPHILGHENNFKQEMQD